MTFYVELVISEGWNERMFEEAVMAYSSIIPAFDYNSYGKNYENLIHDRGTLGPVLQW
jgi:hypothetical protein